MFCEKCNSALPSDGYVCLHCGALMTKSQIEMQKKLREEKRKFASPNYMSAKFGSKREFEYNNSSNNYIIVVCSLIILMVIFVIIVINVI